MDTVLSVRDVVKTFGSVRAVDGVSFNGTARASFGRNTVHVGFDGDGTFLAGSGRRGARCRRPETPNARGRVGILSYGKRPTIPELWRWLKVA